LLGCSTLLNYDDVGFSQPDASADSSLEATIDGQGASGAGADVAVDSTTDGNAAGGTGGVDANASDVVGDPAQNPCESVTCSGFGSCGLDEAGAPICQCIQGYHAEGLACVQDESCTGVQCGRCGNCEVIAGKATCTCPKGFSHDGKSCVTDPDPCDTIDCGPDGYCVPEAHCMVLGACVARCDCSNCGNCGPSNDGRWDDWQEYCGAEPNQGPATMACNKPCPAGEGCLPYSQPICWPMEGCFSL